MEQSGHLLILITSFPSGLCYILVNKCYFFRHTLSTHSKGNGVHLALLPLPDSRVTPEQQGLCSQFPFLVKNKALHSIVFSCTQGALKVHKRKNNTKSYTTYEAVWLRPGPSMQPRLVSNSVVPQASDHWDYRCEQPRPAFPSLPLPPIPALVDRGKRQHSAEKRTHFGGLSDIMETKF